MAENPVGLGRYCSGMPTAPLTPGQHPAHDARPGDQVKVSIRLTQDPNEGVLPGAESLWGTLLSTDGTHSLIRLDNTSFYTTLAHSDIVEARPHPDRGWQVIGLHARGPMSTYNVYLVSEDEVDTGNFPGEMVIRERAVLFGEALKATGFTYSSEGAVGMLPLLVVWREHATPQEKEAFEEALFGLPVDGITTYPQWEGDDPGIENLDPEPIPALPVIATSYDPYSDPQWDTLAEQVLLAPGRTAIPADALRDIVAQLITNDQRVATDLENGVYDRVVTLIQRLVTPPEDLPPLTGPIWPSDAS
jgi:hypothetical protein